MVQTTLQSLSMIPSQSSYSCLNQALVMPGCPMSWRSSSSGRRPGRWREGIIFFVQVPGPLHSDEDGAGLQELEDSRLQLLHLEKTGPQVRNRIDCLSYWRELQSMSLSLSDGQEAEVEEEPQEWEIQKTLYPVPQEEH